MCRQAHEHYSAHFNVNVAISTNEEVAAAGRYGVSFTNARTIRLPRRDEVL
jgi:hypothetical protein